MVHDPGQGSMGGDGREMEPMNMPRLMELGDKVRSGQELTPEEVAEVQEFIEAMMPLINEMARVFTELMQQAAIAMERWFSELPAEVKTDLARITAGDRKSAHIRTGAGRLVGTSMPPMPPIAGPPMGGRLIHGGSTAGGSPNITPGELFTENTLDSLRGRIRLGEERNTQ